MGRKPLVEKRSCWTHTHTLSVGVSAAPAGFGGESDCVFPIRDGVFVRVSESKHKRIAAKHNKRQPIKRKPLRASHLISSHLSFTLTLFSFQLLVCNFCSPGYSWYISIMSFHGHCERMDSLYQTEADDDLRMNPWIHVCLLFRKRIQDVETWNYEFHLILWDKEWIKEWRVYSEEIVFQP